MSEIVLPTGTKSIGKSNLDYKHFETLSKEALRLIRDRKSQCGTNGENCQVIHDQVEDIKEVTKAAVSGRLVTSRQ